MIVRDEKGRIAKGSTPMNGFKKGHTPWWKIKYPNAKSLGEIYDTGFKKGHKLSPESIESMRKKKIEWYKTHEHPRGMLGKRRNEGPKNYLWKGGVRRSYLYRQPEWKVARKNVLEKWGNVCAGCNETHPKLNIHHQVPWRILKQEGIEHHDESFLIPYCPSCHKEVENRWLNAGI